MFDTQVKVQTYENEEGTSHPAAELVSGNSGDDEISMEIYRKIISDSVI